MKKNSDIHILYKKLGETPKECILRFKNENPDLKDLSMTYAGRLDPMAEGLLLVLSGDNLYKKEEFQNLPKVYEVSVLWGFETDSLDILGVVSAFKDKIPSIEEVSHLLKNNIGKLNQRYPNFSSKPVKGKPLFVWAREDRIDEIDIPVHEVSIHEASFLKRELLTKNSLLKEIENRVNLVSGDFRQNEILNSWRKSIFELEKEEFVLDRINLSVSSGFYVRQYIKDIATESDALALTFHIKRISVGDFKIK